jgi:tricorn protease interacting factor F2/3
MDGLRYRLALDLRADSLEYTGQVEIEAREFPSSLTLDTVGHSIRSVRAGRATLPFDRDERTDQLTIREIPTGASSLTVEYAGVVDDRGFRGFYVSPLGAGRLFSTYFEPTAARRLLPCLDRPAEKGRFTVEVSAPAGLTLVSNMPAEERETLPDGRQQVRFAATPPMSTYLLFLAVGPLEELSGSRTDPRVIVAAPPGRAAEGRFVLSEASRAIDYFARYYNEPYPLPKLHLVAVPQFGTGAMENWGAIAFQEHFLLLGDHPPVSAKMRAAEVLAHEIAHQWFGDLVTMRWWNDLWLNESFASFVAIKALEALYPEWSVWDEFLTVRYAGAMLWDALPHTHPVRVDVQDPEQIRQIFDEISYGKGASLLRMGEAYVGEEGFRRGVSNYVAGHRWGNAEAQDLWRSVAAASHEPVERVFSEWIDRPGLPLVRARLEGATLRLDQRRFTLLEPSTDPPWPIPLTVRVGSTVVRRLFDRGELAVDVEAGGVPVVNPGRTGFYRVYYDGSLRARLLARFAELPPVDRWGLASDGFALLLSGATTLDDYLELLHCIETDTEPLVVSEVLTSWLTVYPLLHQIPRWEEAVRRIVIAQTDRLGVRNVAGEPDRIRGLRESLLSARVRLDRPFAAALSKMYPQLESLEPELVRAVLAAYAATAGPEEYRALRARLANAPSAEVARHVAAGLGMVSRDEWVRECLDLVLTGELRIGPWIDLCISALLTNPDRSEAVWSFLVDRIDTLSQAAAGTGLTGLLLQHAVPLLGITRPAEMRAWVAGRSFPEGQLGATKGLDLLEVYTRVLDRCR